MTQVYRSKQIKFWGGTSSEVSTAFLFNVTFRKHKTFSKMQGYVHLVGKGICKF